MSETTDQHRRLTLSSVIPVWVAALIGDAVVVALADHATRFAWLLVVLVGTLLLGFALQLATQTKDGLVARFGLASVGAFVAVFIGAVVLLIAG